MPRVSEVFSPSLTKVPSTSLGCGLAVKQVAYGKSGFLLPALRFVLNIEYGRQAVPIPFSDVWVAYVLAVSPS